MQAPAPPASPAAESAAAVVAQLGPQMPNVAPVQPDSESRPPFLLRPSISLNDVGIDTNVFGTAANPQQDTIGHVRLRIEPSLQTDSLTLNGTASAGLSYFEHYTDQRSFDTADAFRLDYRINRVTLFTADSFLRTRDIFSPELDTRLPRLENTADAGAMVRLTGKTQIVGDLRHARFLFTADPLVAALDLHSTLTRTEDSAIVSLRNAITPLTTFVVTGEYERDRFDFSSFRNGNGVRVLGGMEFKPTAFISGTAFVGYRSRMSTDGSYPDASTVVASLDLGYNPWEPVRFGIKINRDLDHSFFSTERYYIVNGVSGSVTVRFAEFWEVGGTVGRETLDYGAANLIDPLSGQALLGGAPWSERVLHFGGAVGYRLGRSAVLRFTPDYIRRNSAIALRTYNRLRLVSSVTIGYD